MDNVGGIVLGKVEGEVVDRVVVERVYVVEDKVGVGIKNEEVDFLWGGLDYVWRKIENNGNED